jgi:ribonuclease HI
MIEIEVYAKNFQRKGTICAVNILRGRHKWVKTMKCGDMTTNQAELKAFEYALSAVKEQYVNEPISVTSAGKYANLILSRNEDGTWKKNYKNNGGLIDVVRNQWKRFKNITLGYAKLEWLSELAVNALDGEDIFVKED